MDEAEARHMAAMDEAEAGQADAPASAEAAHADALASAEATHACALAAAKLSSGGDETAMRNSLDAAKATAEVQRRREREIRPDLTEEEASELAAARAVCDDMLDRSSIVGDRGDNDLLQDAFQDGSSVVCVRCGDLVARTRWDAHRTTWCRMIPDDSEEDDSVAS